MCRWKSQVVNVVLVQIGRESCALPVNRTLQWAVQLTYMDSPGLLLTAGRERFSVVKTHHFFQHEKASKSTQVIEPKS